MIMFYSKTPLNTHFRQEQIQPWNADDPNIMNIIISSEKQTHKRKETIFNHNEQSQKHRLLDQGHSYNFYNNLRKYEQKKAEDFLSKKQVNFIQRNIKGVSQEFSQYQEHSPEYLVDKMIQEKQEKSKMINSPFSCTIEPINWNVITQNEERKIVNKLRQKKFQNFIIFQSQNHKKPTIKQMNNQERLDEDESVKFDSDKYKKLLKMRQGLRKRNLKSCDDSRRKMEDTLNIEQNWKSSKLASVGKVKTTSLKTSHAVRRKNTLNKFNTQQQQQVQLSGIRYKLYSSQHNRVKISLRAI